MIKQNIKTTLGSITLSVPDQLGEISLGQLIAMQAKENLSDMEAIEILSGTPLTELQNIKNPGDLDIFNAPLLALSAAIKNLYTSDSLPSTVSFRINGRNKTIKVATNLGVEPAGAYFAARDIITDEITRHIEQYGEEDWKSSFNPSLNSCALILAHYFYCVATGLPYSEQQAEEFAEQVKQLAFTDALPIAKYFFLSYPNLSKPKTGFWQRVQLRWKKRPELSLFKNLATSILLTR
ncbi:hypothetical protein MUY27_03065 [Mucilaginibacter sp. RS28]|uniref:Uncharacterized protein n=1 Tax=Mucilaginibacter straminoryzae TaxID=2932774 RepID=A0A9X1WZV1_9SPHI|nr:hypothetical protein [Mucilaginibacter straminoryzae]MCJ8208672.1 hypothetical protein [Mucilaginibacter straminoryzae]